MVMKFIADINWRKSVISLATEYVNYVWTPTEKNRYHGYDREGISVDTPDYGYESTSYHCGWWQVNQKNKGGRRLFRSGYGMLEYKDKGYHRYDS